MRILVTGASGLLGINLALEASRDHQVFGLVNDHRLHTAAFQVVDGDLLIPGTAERLLDEIQPDWVIHCAALANLDACEADPARARQLNTEVPRLLAELVARGGARLLHVSTDAVFDGLRGDYNEEDIPSPVGVYSQTKQAAEQAVSQANPQAIIARVNLFGYSLTRKRSLGEFFLYNLQAGKQVMGFTDVLFCPLLANDLAQIFIEMLTQELTGLYHVVSSDCISKYEFGVRLARSFGLDATLIQPTMVAQSGLMAVRSPKLNLRSNKLASALGHPLPTITSGLELYYELFQAGYPDLIRRMSTQI
jgi:dTDP-4-dehydrorhamnose reductase